MLAAQSFRSLPSYKSFKSSKSHVSSDVLSDSDFEFCLSEVFKRYNCPVAVVVGKEYIIRGDRKGLKTRESKLKYRRITAPPVIPDASSIQTFYGPEEGITLELIAKYDHGHLIELKISDFKKIIIPGISLKLLGLIIKNYTQLNKFTIKNSYIDKYAVLEIGKILNRSTITELCLDDCPLHEANYEILLGQRNSCLKALSLCRCRINDEMCKRLAAKLHFREHAEHCLVTLSLSSNDISDAGAIYFAEALRSNRHLRYLNLADNSISDEGASHLLNKLVKFPLTDAEDRARRHRHMIYLRMKHKLYLECLRNMEVSSAAPSIHTRRSTSSKQRAGTSRKSISHVKRKSFQKIEHEKSTTNEENMNMKADLIARQLAGPFLDPFCPSSIKIEDGIPYCVGNFVLCYLNIAYNDLTYFSITKLLSVVEYQHVHLQSDDCGLMRVLVYGNPLPTKCVELANVQKLLNDNMSRAQHKLRATSKISKTSKSELVLLSK
uniref:Uncharacterized protein n=1 Tax=Heliothis virescens TaxID=7102 RepID=A0A2A4KA31_HELVI